ncbi:MAG: site-2 protease family protein [Novosphingobium sp.]
MIAYEATDQYRLFSDPLGSILLVVLLGFLSTVVHEFGHAWASWKLGYRVHRIAVFPIEFDLERGRFVKARIPDSSDIAGYVVADAPENARHTAMVALAGPALEAIVAIAIFLAASIYVDRQRSGWEAGCSISASVGRTPEVVSRLPSDECLQEVAERVRNLDLARIVDGVVHVFAIVALGGALINLVPISGSDGQQILLATRRHVTSKRR